MIGQTAGVALDRPGIEGEPVALVDPGIVDQPLPATGLTRGAPLPVGGPAHRHWPRTAPCRAALLGDFLGPWADVDLRSAIEGPGGGSVTASFGIGALRGQTTVVDPGGMVAAAECPVLVIGPGHPPRLEQTV